MSDMMDKLMEAKAVVDGERDNLLQAIAMLSAAGQISIVPQNNNLTSRPVIMLPQRMYDRLVEITSVQSKEDPGDGS